MRIRAADAVPLRSAPGLDDDLASRVIDAARRRTPVANYLVWSRFPYVAVSASGDGWDVVYADARYDSEPGAGGLAGLRVHVTPSEIR